MSFTDSVTRPIAQGDTPSIINQKTRTLPMTNENIPKGTPCVVVAGFVTIATLANTINLNSGVVPVESIDNSAGSAGDLNIKVVDAGPETGPYVALTSSVALTIDQYISIDATPVIIAFADTLVKYARYIGKEAGVFSRDGSTPFDQTLSVGQVPQQDLLADEVGWFKIVERGD